MIKVSQIAGGDPSQFEVLVSDDRGESRHLVTARTADLARLAPGETSGRLIEAAFHFLLDRESKESILSRFDITVIASYFPEFDREIGRYLKRTQS